IYTLPLHDALPILEQQLNPQLSSCLIYQLRLIQSTTASFCLYCQVWAFLAGHTPGLSLTSLGALSTCHGKGSCLYLTTPPQGSPQPRWRDHLSAHPLVGSHHPLAWFFISLLCR